MAQRIQLKRSSLLGKRPDAAYLEPGELALNTNSSTAGVFFETNDGNITKAGPTYIGTLPPPSDIPYGNGETWYDEGNGTFNTYKAATEQWVPTLSPLFGGGLTVIFVGTEFPEATDDLSNDGSARPFATINRAAIEVARRSILPGRPDDPYNARFLVILLPGENTVVNSPGLSVNDYQRQVTPFTADQALTISELSLFNPTDGGLIFPRGTSIFGFDMTKTQIRPTYYPAWSRSQYLESPETIDPRTAQIKWTGNSFFNNITFLDKPAEVSVKSISGLPTQVAVCTSLKPHGYRALEYDADGVLVAGDKVKLSYSEEVSQSYDGETTVREGEYYVSPITPTTFTLVDVGTNQTLIRNQLPEFPVPGSSPAEYFNLTYTNTTHHRLSTTMFATKTELNNFYYKIQVAFANLDFGGRAGNAEVAPGEVDIVAPVPASPTQTTNETNDSAPFLENVSLRSNFGQCGLSVDGALVEGFKSANTAYMTAISLQNDADVYDVFYEGRWMSLKKAYSIATGTAEASISNELAMQYLDASVPLPNLRFFFDTTAKIEVTTISPTGASEAKNYSSGLPDEQSDTRHWAVRASNGGYCQVTSCFDVGTAVGFWAYTGGRLTISNSQSNFGFEALRSEGFEGIGTDGGALAPDKGFGVKGIRRPLALSNTDLKNPLNHQKIYLGRKIVTTSTTTIVLDAPLDESVLLPFTLRPGTVIWTISPVDGSTYKATLASSPLSPDKRTINVLAENNTIHIAPNIGTLYIRRFKDPRKPEDKTFQLWVGNSNESHRAPTAGKILRLSKSSETGAATPLVAGRQFDPGENGGWNQVFSVQSSVAAVDGNNPNHVQGDVQPSQQTSAYYLELKLCDSAGPWIGGGTEAITGTDRRYAQGQLTTYAQRAYVAKKNELETGLLTPVPPSTDSSWTLSMTTEVFQSTKEAFIPKDYPNAADPYSGEYGEFAEYARGLQCRKDAYQLNDQSDLDDGTANLGLAESAEAEKANSVETNPAYSNSREAVSRFLSLLGFSFENIATMLVAQDWPDRQLPVTSFPRLTPAAGYALSVAEWPVEFNRGSSIICGDHTWEFPGYLNYTKGLPEYQTSSLSATLRFDSIETSVWGGSASYYGNTELGELVLYGVDIVGGGGQILAL